MLATLTLGSPVMATVVHSDGTNTQDWSVYTSSEGTIKTVDGRIDLSGDAWRTGYKLDLNNVAMNTNAIRWSMKYDETFAVYIVVTTDKGKRYLHYTPVDGDKGKKDAPGSNTSAKSMTDQYVRFGLGVDADNGTWQTFTRNVVDDLTRFEPNNRLLSIDEFMIRGSGELDNIETFTQEDKDSFDHQKFAELLDNLEGSPESPIDDIEYLNDNRYVLIKEYDVLPDNIFTVYTLSEDGQRLRYVATMRYLDPEHELLITSSTAMVSGDGSFLTYYAKMTDGQIYTESYDISDINNVKKLPTLESVAQ